MNLVDDYPEEGERIQFLLDRDGLRNTDIFVEQTMGLYRKAVVFKRDPCKNRDYRIKYVKAYLEFKRFKQADLHTLAQLIDMQLPQLKPPKTA